VGRYFGTQPSSFDTPDTKKKDRRLISKELDCVKQI
jgi:hypothetical protein